jgi:hypothetical protein
MQAQKISFVDPKWEAAQPLFSWFGLLSPVFWLVLLVGMSISLFLTETQIASNAYLQEYSRGVRQFLLQISSYADINAHAKTTSFPKVALLSHAFLWTSAALLFTHNTISTLVKWKYWMEWFEVVRPCLMSNEVSTKKTIFAWLFVVIGLVVFTMMGGSTSFVGNADLTNPVFFSFLTGCFIFMSQIVTSGWLPLAYFLIKRQLGVRS